jgi:hypothetical protein
LGLALVHAEFDFEDADDKFAGGEIIVDENDLVEFRALDLRAGFELEIGIVLVHRGCPFRDLV